MCWLTREQSVCMTHRALVTGVRNRLMASYMAFITGRRSNLIVADCTVVLRCRYVGNMARIAIRNIAEGKVKGIRSGNTVMAVGTLVKRCRQRRAARYTCRVTGITGKQSSMLIMVFGARADYIKADASIRQCPLGCVKAVTHLTAESSLLSRRNMAGCASKVNIRGILFVLWVDSICVWICTI